MKTHATFSLQPNISPRVVICVIASLLAVGCKREATGQVAAVVNGEEITMQEVNAELGNATIPANVDSKAIQQAALQRVIERRLVAHIARTDGVDKNPEFLMKKRQLEENLLVQMLGDKVGRATAVPTAEQIDRYMASRPNMFAQRTIYKVDRLQFALPNDGNVMRGFESDHSMAAVIARLNAAGLKFNRSTVDMDSAIVPVETLARLKGLPAGEPFLVPNNNMVSVGVIVGSSPAPLLGETARPLAVQVMRNEAVAKSIQDRLKAARASAKIEYQAGFAPAKPVAAKPAAPAK